MRGAGPVGVNGAGVYGYFAEDGGRVRLRLGLDDWDRLGLCEGCQAEVRLPGREAATVLVLAARREPPVVWLELAPLAPRRAG